MKRIAVRLLSVLASAALFATAVLPVGVAAATSTPGHTHGGGYVISGEYDYTITLTHPDKDATFNEDNSHYGAYQIFSGSVPKKGEENAPSDTDLTNPGDTHTPLPITDIKWGNAFGITSAMDPDNKIPAKDRVTDDQRRTNIVAFVHALAKAPTGSYSYAFSDFTGFEKFFDTSSNLVSDYLINTSPNVTVTTAADGKISVSNLDNVNYEKLAVSVAGVLADTAHINNREWLQAFADILGGYGQGTGGAYKNVGFVNYFYEGKVNDDDSKKYEITVPAGYYMVRDLSGFESTETDQTYSARMLFVANDITQSLKEDVPELEKTIIRDTQQDYIEDNPIKTEAAGVGDVVKFQLNGTLPSNYDLYLGGYQYKFIDTLSKGLTLNGEPPTCVKIYAKGVYDSTNDSWNFSDEFEITQDSFDTNIGSGHHLDGTIVDKAYDVKVDPAAADHGQTLTVTFPCLKEIVLTKDGTKYVLGYNSATNQSSQIYVVYTAKVNENALVKPDDTTLNGNQNEAALEYSDNPQSTDDTDTTTIDRARVYTYGVDLAKYDYAKYFNKDHAEAALDSAEFVILRLSDETANNHWQIATIHTYVTSPKRYEIIEWKDLKTVEADGTSLSSNNVLSTVTGDNLIKAAKDFIKLETTNTYAFKTDNSTAGHATLWGLDDTITYTFVETKLPETNSAGTSPYVQLKPFTITLTAAKNVNEYNGKISEVNATPSFSANSDVSIEKFVMSTEAKDTNTTGVAPIDVINFKYENLPSTGGMGVYIYYIIGGALIAGAIVLFAVNRKKARKN